MPAELASILYSELFEFCAVNLVTFQAQTFFVFCKIIFSGYTRDEANNCTIEINECDSTPCLNGAICTDLLDQFHCNCVFGKFLGQGWQPFKAKIHICMISAGRIACTSCALCTHRLLAVCEKAISPATQRDDHISEIFSQCKFIM